MEEKKLGIVFASGAANRVCCVVVYAAAALSMGWRVTIHLVNEGLVAFRKDTANKVWSEKAMDYSIVIKEYEKNLGIFFNNAKEMLQQGKLQNWPEALADLKSTFGDKFHIYACPLAAATYGVKKEDLLDIVDDIKDANAFLEEVYGGVTMYI
ncbi:MAG: DsrE/DsrF/DrsH-like family protein [Thermocladium sp.]